ncbi:Rid family hydrolase [Enterococcus alcedinis]|uniref:Reactive intermediate/imine deaminase n=1 Tax=Enterococcus alcedinis TaxID=1274384 RepID=A0A917JF29_9ENTE|nr:RidA family protein [Enterococcus alcedinis]MBP2101906.1 reactive intermediate/imine deaminase [Enterococcus alcedinis]GGI65469.1 reactive intermediate/imine deaminase [Enterococcus alcedinis]
MSEFNAVAGRNTDLAPKNEISSQTVAFSHYNNLSAQLPVDTNGQLVEGDIKAQATQIFKNIEAIVKSLDHVMSDVVRLSIFVKDIQDVDAIDEVFTTFFPTYMPARTVVAVDALPVEGALLQIDALITHGEGTIPNAPQAGDLIKLTNTTTNAPVDALASQTVAFSHYNNLSAQLPIDPKTGRLVIGGVKEQTRQALQNIKEILLSIDVPLDDIVKTTIFVKDLADMEVVNEVYTTFFPDSAIARAVAYMPARTVVEVADLQMGALVQIEAVVSHGDGTPPQAIEDRHGIVIWAENTDAAPVDALSTQTVAFSHYNHLSAQLPIDAKTGELVATDIKAQTTQSLSHIQSIVESIDHVLADVVKVNIYVTNMADMAIVDEVYATFFPGGVPARRVVGVSNLPKGALIQIDAVVGNAEGTPIK